MTGTRDSMNIEIVVTAPPGDHLGELRLGAHSFACALGRTGLVNEKREGDGGTPVGRFPLRRLRYREDRLAAPQTGLPLAPILPHDGWCDAPGDAAYNQPVHLPYSASAEAMWRQDHLYDLVVILGHNDDPAIPGAGSAIFFHLAGEKDGALQPTEGCIALRLDDMQTVLGLCGEETYMRIERA